MNETGNRYFTVNGGISLILLVFVILSMVSFAALSVSSARADARISEKYIQQNEAYYRAWGEAQKWLWGLGRPDAAMYRENDDTSPITARFDAGPTQELVITIELLPGHEADSDADKKSDSNTHEKSGSRPDEEPVHCYKVISEKIESTATFEYDESLPVIQ